MAGLVKLTRDEAERAVQEGARRQLDNILKKRPSQFETADSWQKHIQGALAEVAVAKYYGRYWFGFDRSPTTLAGDVGNWQVRSGDRPNSKLWVRHRDRQRGHLHQRFILVIVDVENLSFRLIGWIKGEDAVANDDWKEPASNGRPEAWAVPQDKLEPIGTPQLQSSDPATTVPADARGV